MNSVSIGDLAHSYLLQRRGSSLRAEMSKLNQELTSGQVADIKSILAGNFSYLSDIETSMSHLNAYKTSSAEATQFTSAMQSALDVVQTQSTDLGTNILSVVAGGIDAVSRQVTVEAREQLGAIVNTLNTDLAGRSIFSGTASNQAPLASSTDILNSVRSVMAGQIGPTNKLAAVDAWFADPAGFDAVIYQGSSDAMAPFRLSEHEDLSLDVRANDKAIKDVIRNVAVAALANDAALGIDFTERAALLNDAGVGLMTNAADVTALRANIGFIEERIDDIATRNSIESTSLEYAKGALLSVDPYETATRLEEVQFQLQSLYTVTVRSSELTLVNFL
ncbi:flagellin [Ascidiaceihabitans sp.]|uniref:flagellin n=1 Tax=Ascidiaceihabitans sp. TaxID=1872644 RepID=UPI0032995289